MTPDERALVERVARVLERVDATGLEEDLAPKFLVLVRRLDAENERLRDLLRENEGGVFGVDPITRELTEPWTAEGAFQWHKRVQAALAGPEPHGKEV